MAQRIMPILQDIYSLTISYLPQHFHRLGTMSLLTMMKSLSACLPFLSQVGATILVPETTGPHKVGTTVLELIDYARQDPFAPTPQPRDLVVSLFYPTDPQAGTKSCRLPLAPQFPPLTAAIVDDMYNQSGIAETITTRSYLNAPLSRPDLPLLFFGPGAGASRLFYSDLAEEMASYGWNVVTVDNPYDSIVVEYPDGRLAVATDSPAAANATPAELVDVRVADFMFVLDSLANSTIVSGIPGLGGDESHSPMDRADRKEEGTERKRTPKFPIHSVGVYGHSLGGASALQVMSNDTRFQAGVDFDGSVYGPVVQEGTDKPFLLFTRPDDAASDTTWGVVWPNLRGPKRQYVVNGTTHYSFTDLPGLRDVLGAYLPPSLSAELGSINGTRLVGIERAFMQALFDRYLKGFGGDLLDGKGLELWPEVTLRME